MTTAAEKVNPEQPAAGKTAEKRKALGRGLESLLPGPRMVSVAGSAAGIPLAAVPTVGGAATARNAGGAPAPHSAAGVETPPPHELSEHSGVIGDIHAQAARSGSVIEIPLDQIDRNPYQTRYKFGEEAIQELADSIKANGVVQPVVVRPSETEGRYVLVLGERRCRASKMAGKTAVPAIVRRVSDQQAAEMTIVENLQRQDLNCMEQAAAFGKLSQKFKLTQEQIGQRVGLSRESVSNYMRLLNLPGTVMMYLQNGELGFSEARLLLQFKDNQQIARLADEAVRKHMSVEQIEDLCIKEYVREEDKQKPGRARWVDPNVRAAQRELEQVLGLRVRISDRRGKGKILIEYGSVDDYERVVGRLRGK